MWFDMILSFYFVQCLAALVRRTRAADLNQQDNEKVYIYSTKMSLIFIHKCSYTPQMTALHWSAYNNTPDNVRLLLKAVSKLSEK